MPRHNYTMTTCRAVAGRELTHSICIFTAYRHSLKLEPLHKFTCRKCAKIKNEASKHLFVACLPFLHPWHPVGCSVVCAKLSRQVTYLEFVLGCACGAQVMLLLLGAGFAAGRCQAINRLSTNQLLPVHFPS